ncbi:MAG: hypothetical protein V4573_19035 [Pseudomonadota bacterium]
MLAAGGVLAACGEQESAPVTHVAITQINVECPVPESLLGKVVAVRLSAERVGEPPEKDQPPLEGGFGTNAVDLTLSNGANIPIRLDEPMFFSVKSHTVHTGCEQFRWKSLGDVTVFEYIYGTGNPYPPQQLMYSRGSPPKFKSLWELLTANEAAFYEIEKSNPACLSGLAKGDGEVERWCYEDGKLNLNRKMLRQSFADGEYRFACDFSGRGPLLVSTSIVKPEPNRAPPEYDDIAVLAVFTDKCKDQKMLLQAKAIDEK